MSNDLNNRIRRSDIYSAAFGGGDVLRDASTPIELRVKRSGEDFASNIRKEKEFKRKEKMNGDLVKFSTAYKHKIGAGGGGGSSGGSRS